MTRKQILLIMGAFLALAIFCSWLYVSNLPAQPQSSPTTPAVPEQATEPPLPTRVSSTQTVIAIAYEKAGQTGRLMTFAISTSPEGSFSFSPQVTNQVSASGRKFATIDLARGSRPNEFWWCMMDLESNAQRLLQMDASLKGGAIPGTDIPQGQHIQDLIEVGDGNVLVRSVSSKHGPQIEVRNKEGSLGTFLMNQIRDTSYTSLLPVRDRAGNHLGTVFSSIEPGRIFYIPANHSTMNDLELGRDLFPQSLAVRPGENSAQLCAYGMSPLTREITQMIFELHDDKIVATSGIALRPRTTISTAGVGHAFVQTERGSGAPLANLLCWDTPILFTFQGGSQTRQIAVASFFQGTVTQVEVKQGVPLSTGAYHFAFTAEGRRPDGTMASVLVLATLEGFRSFESTKLSNGLAVGKHWLAWDLRGRGAGESDDLMVLELREAEVSQNTIPLGIATERRNLPSIICVNETR